MNHRFGFMGIAIGLAVAFGLTIGARVTSPVLAAHVAKPAARQRLVWQTNFRHGTLGWMPTGNATWRGINHQLVVDGGTSQIVPPYSPKSLSRYAVEASIQFVDRQPSFFGLVVRTVPGNNPSANADPQGIYGSVYADDGTGSIYSSSQLGLGYVGLVFCGSCIIGGDGIKYFRSSDYDADHHWHMYRLEVRGNRYRILVDGVLATSGISNSFLGNSTVGLFSIGASIDVRVFKVFALR